MLTLLDSDRARAAALRNNRDDDALRLAPSLRQLFGLDDASDYGPELVQFVAEFQQSRGLLADGVIGPQTRRQLEPLTLAELSACDALWPRASTIEQQLAHFGALSQAGGFRGGSGRPTLLALRGVWLFGRRIHPVWHAPLYDDAFIFLREGAAPFAFRGATHPYQRDSNASADLDHDGRKDVGMVRPGCYVLEVLRNDPPIFKLLTDRGSAQIPVYRDTNHDARIEEVEKSASALATSGEQVAPGVGAFGTEILLHPGYDARQSPHGLPFSSIGCQTAPIDALRQILGAARAIDYVLLDAIDLLPVLGSPVDVA
jgi:hypothetical protein